MVRSATLVCREEFPRLYELRNQLQDPLSPDAYDFDTRGESVILKHFRDIEKDLQALDSASWSCIRADLVPLLTKRDAKRGWQALFDKLNEAKGYNYLVRAGYADVAFIPRSSTPGQKTPDLQGSLGGTRVLCEVKTINVSEVECAHRKNSSVRTILIELPLGFFNKLKSDLETARNQMATYCPADGTKKIAFVIINYDDLLHEYADVYKTQVNAFIATTPVPDLEIVFDIKPPFYSAMA